MHHDRRRPLLRPGIHAIGRLGLGAALLALLAGCGAPATTFVHSDTTLGRVVVYRNGVAYFERSARVDGQSLKLAVPADKVDDFLKSLTVLDKKTGQPAPISFPTQPPSSATGLIDMEIGLGGTSPHDVLLSYVTDAPSWKPSYRIVLLEGGKISVEAWAIVDNTSGEDWKNVKLGVGSSSALSFRYDLRSIRVVQRETLRSDDLFAQAPPTGGATFAQSGPGQPQRLVVELSDDVLAGAKDEEQERRRDKSPKESSARKSVAQGGGAGYGRSAAAPAQAPMPAGALDGAGYGAAAAPQVAQQMQAMARQIQGNTSQVVVEGYADKGDGDKFAASLERANRAREQLVRNGVDPNRVVAVGRGEQVGRAGGVRIVEEPVPQRQPESKSEPAATPDGPPPEPIGTSHFESKVSMTVPRGTSAMVSILKTDADGEVVYLYDAESPRGNEAFAFRSVRLRNPTDSVLESGPVTVFGHGKFIGEGLCEPIPARSTAFVPFALDRQVQVEKKHGESDSIARILTVQRGVFSTEVKHKKKTTLTLRNRLDQPAVVYVRHTVPEGYALTKAMQPAERVGGAHLFRAELPASGQVDLVIEEETPLFKTTDIRSAAGMDLVVAYLSSAALEGRLKEAVQELLKRQREMANIEQRIATIREQMDEYRARMDELHAQVITLRAVKSAGALTQSLERKLAEVSDKLSKATIELVSQQEKLMIARIQFQDGVADLTLEEAK